LIPGENFTEEDESLMWTCPKCKHKFVNKNQAHSCGSYTVANFLKGKSEYAIEIFHYFISQYRTIGYFDLHPVKTRIALLTQMRFCAVNNIGPDFIDVHFVLTKPYYKAGCFRKIENLADKYYIHHARIRQRKDINAEIKKYMRLAFDVGNRNHVRSKRRYIKDLQMR
jgi:hypothetical protein